ncbi:adenosylcobinamide-phosphate synthase CbiB [Hyphomonas sp.]|jgi:adenosylcobinamide-phosphate synthase|uniref:adenosylcobinamide-phosphate synthase CbiB n=1 Tax=Hyphomonas sp. TaxID=87 RepID=UPI0032D92CEF
MGFALLMLCAWGIEVSFGWPDQLYRRIGHPVVWLGWVIHRLDRTLNRPEGTHAFRYALGGISTLLIVGGVAALACVISRALPQTFAGFLIEAALASPLIASRSLYTHVANVARPLAIGDLGSARQAVSMIVGRDPAHLESEGLARAALESLAENMSDGVIAPVFWGLVFGLPGIAAYKAVNTLDSMIGHRSKKYAAFGGVAARLDDLANLVPARLTGGLICLAAIRWRAVKVMLRDARRHRSPNAGWPEAAMAGALDVRLSGPRAYEGQTSNEPWLNGVARDPAPEDLTRGLALYKTACAVALGTVALMALAEALM